MKKLFSLLFSGSLILSVFTLSSCNDTGIPVTIPQAIDISFIVPANNDSSFLISREIAGNVDSILATQNATRDDVAGIYITGVSVGETDSSGTFLPQINWYQLDTVFAYIGDPARPVELDSLVAFCPDLISLPLANGYVYMTLQTTDFDIVPYIVKPKYRFTVKGKSKNLMSKDLYYRVLVNTNFSVYL